MLNNKTSNNALYNPDEGIVYINNNAEFKGEEIAEFVATHEVAHITEGTRAYAEMAIALDEIVKDQNAPAALKAKIGDVKARKKAIRDTYQGQMKNMSLAQREYLVETELTADLAGIVFSDEYAINKLAERNLPLVKKIFNGLKALVKRNPSATTNRATSLYKGGIDGESARYLSKLVNKFGKAIDKSQGGVKISQLGREDEETEQSEVENVRFSKKMVPGTNEKFVLIEKTSIEKLMSFPGETLSAKVRNYLKQFRGTVLPLGSTDKAYMRREAEGEYTNPAKVVSETDYEGKLNAASEFENLLESAQFVDHQPDNGRHPDATRGWNYYELKYVVPTNDGVRAYKGQIQIKLIDRGDCFYDITKIEDITNGAAGQALIKAAGSADISSNNSISENGEKINTFGKKIDDERKSISKSERFTPGRHTEMQIAEELVNGYDNDTLSANDALRKLNALGYKTGINIGNVLDTLDELIPEIREFATSEREAYRESNRKDTAKFIESVSKMNDKSQLSKRKKKIGTLSREHAEIVTNLMKNELPGFSADGYELWIDGTGAKHIEDRHGVNGSADNSMATTEAKELISWAAQNAEKGYFIKENNGEIKRSKRFFNSDGSRAPEIRLEKQIDGDTVCVSECVPDSSNRRIWITSAYIKKGSKGQLLNMDEKSSPQPTPEASFDSTATNTIIPEKSQKSNSEQKNPS